MNSSTPAVWAMTAFLIAALAAGCADRPAPLSLPPVVLTEDDLDVLAAALRSIEAAAIVPAPRGGALATTDRTIRVCVAAEYVPLPHECVGARELLGAEHVVRGLFGEAAIDRFRSGNRAPLAIPTGFPAARVIAHREVADLMGDAAWPLRLRRHYPGVSRIVFFTAPIYPAAGESVVVASLPPGGAFVAHLVREGSGWAVRRMYEVR